MNTGQPVEPGSHAWDSPIEMDHRDVPGCLCPSGIVGVGVFEFRWGVDTVSPHFTNSADSSHPAGQ